MDYFNTGNFNTGKCGRSATVQPSAATLLLRLVEIIGLSDTVGSLYCAFYRIRVLRGCVLVLFVLR